MSEYKIPKKTGIQWLAWLHGEIKNLVENLDQVASEVWAAIYLVFQKGVREGKSIQVLVDDQVVAIVQAVRKFLNYLGTDVIPDLPMAKIKEFLRTRNGLFIGDGFNNLVLKYAQDESDCPSFTQDKLGLEQKANDFEIQKDLKGRVFTDVNRFCRYLMYRLEQQWGGKAGTLHTDGKATILILLVNGEAVVVFVGWRSDGRLWGVSADQPRDFRWGAGRQVLAPATAA